MKNIPTDPVVVTNTEQLSNDDLHSVKTDPQAAPPDPQSGIPTMMIRRPSRWTKPLAIALGIIVPVAVLGLIAAPLLGNKTAEVEKSTMAGSSTTEKRAEAAVPDETPAADPKPSDEKAAHEEPVIETEHLSEEPVPADEPVIEMTVEEAAPGDAPCDGLPPMAWGECVDAKYKQLRAIAIALEDENAALKAAKKSSGNGGLAIAAAVGWSFAIIFLVLFASSRGRRAAAPPGELENLNP